MDINTFLLPSDLIDISLTSLVKSPFKEQTISSVIKLRLGNSRVRLIKTLSAPPPLSVGIKKNIFFKLRIFAFNKNSFGFS